MLCPNCGEYIHDAETIDTEWYCNTYYDEVCGTCSKCGKTYIWTEKFIFSGYEDVKEITEM